MTVEPATARWVLLTGHNEWHATRAPANVDAGETLCRRSAGFRTSSRSAPKSNFICRTCSEQLPGHAGRVAASAKWSRSGFHAQTPVILDESNPSLGASM